MKPLPAAIALGALEFIPKGLHSFDHVLDHILVTHFEVREQIGHSLSTKQSGGDMSVCLPHFCGDTRRECPSFSG